MYIKKFNKYFFIALVCSYCLLLFGCASVPTPQLNLPVYMIHGREYVSLVDLCHLRNVDLNYDTFSQKVDLNSNTHKINLKISDPLILVDGMQKTLNTPAEFYQGRIVVPVRFKNDVFDPLFGLSIRPVLTFNYTDRIKTIVIDPGHGGYDPGAIGRTGLREKDVNLDIARRLSQGLKSSGFKVVMTRSSDIFIPLERRVSIANQADADLFVSIHSNANPARAMNGFEIYHVAPSVSDAARAVIAAKERSPGISSMDVAGKSSTLNTILWDMVFAQNRAESVELSKSICKSVDTDLGLKILGIKAARFHVLRGTQMPAILIEIGFLSNREEEKLLKNSFHREQLAQSIADGIKSYAKDLSLAEASRK